jgi:hypothetical protein
MAVECPQNGIIYSAHLGQWRITLQTGQIVEGESNFIRSDGKGRTADKN